MTTEEQQLCQDLLILTNGLRSISKEEFLRRFPSSIEHGKLALRLLEEAYKTQNARDLQCALVVGFTFGFAPEQTDILCHLVEADWHFCHENVVSALDELQTPAAVEALFYATQWVPEYLKFDDYRALAVKAIWAIGKLPGNETEAKLKALTHSDNRILRRNALEQLKLRRETT